MNLTDDEMRVKCAEAMGWTRLSSTAEENQSGLELWRSPLQTKGIMKGPWFKFDAVPNYPASVDAALTLCDRLREEGWSVWISASVPANPWTVSIAGKRGRPTLHTHNPSLARAICLAFLRVRGLDSVACSL